MWRFYMLIFVLSFGICNGKHRVSIARARRRHLREIVKLVVSVFFEEGTIKHKRLLKEGRTLRQEEEACYEDLIERLDKVQTSLFIAEVRDADRDQSRIVGFTEIVTSRDYCFKLGPGYPFKEQRPMINSLVVHKEFRRQGLGLQLMAACVAQARLWGHSEVMLEVRKDNAAGIAFYERLGFRENRYARSMESNGREVVLFMRDTGLGTAPLPSTDTAKEEDEEVLGGYRCKI